MKTQIKKPKRSRLTFEALESRHLMAQVGFINESTFTNSTPLERQYITTAGFEPVELKSADLDTTDLKSYAAIIVAPGKAGTDLRANFSYLADYARQGGALIIHDNQYSNIKDKLPATVGTLPTLTNTNSIGDNIDFYDLHSVIADGPFGKLTNDAVDGGRWSTHGAFPESQVPAGATKLVHVGGHPESVVEMRYSVGLGNVTYSMMPFEGFFYENGSNGLATVMSKTFGPNELVSAVNWDESSNLNFTTAVDYKAGFATGTTPLSLNGSAKIAGDRLSLTTKTTGQAGSAFAPNKVDVNEFNTEFDFQISPGSYIADGFTFVIQNSGSKALGSSGGYLGYGSFSNSFNKSVAIKFDIYSNGQENANYGPESSNCTGLFTNGIAPMGKTSIDLSSKGIDLHSGHIFHTDMTYDGATLTVNIKDTTTNAVATQVYTIDIPATVGGDSAYVGFTGGTGSAVANQDILDWTFSVPINGLHVSKLESVLPDPRNTPVDALEVTFSEAINPATFTIADLALTRDGGSNLITNAASIVSLGDNRYSVQGLSTLTAAEGKYKLTINTTGINSALNVAGTGNASESWTLDTTAPTLDDVIDVTPDVRIGAGKAVSSVDLVFSEDVDLTNLTSYTPAISLERNHGNVALDSSITLTSLGSGKVRVNGLSKFTNTDGEYQLTFSAFGLKDKAGNAAVGIVQDSWIAGQPELVPLTPSLINTPVDAVDVIFPTTIDPATFTSDDLTLKHYGVVVPLAGSGFFSIEQIDLTHYRVHGTQDFAHDATGTYSLTLNAEGILTNSGTALKGTSAITWTVDQKQPYVVDVVDVTPDPRTGVGKGVASVDVVYSENIDLTSLDANDFILTRDGVPVPLDASITFTSPAANRVRVNGLASFTSLGGKYIFSAASYGVRDIAGNIGINGVVSDVWLANDPPVVAVSGSIVYREGAAPLPLAAFGQVADADTPIFNKGKLTVTLTNGTASDSLSIVSRGKSTGQIFVNPTTKNIQYSGVIIGQFSGGDAGTPLVITLNNNASIAATQALVASVAFSSTDDFLQPTNRQVSFVLEDGEGGTSRTAVKTVSIVPVNTAPKLTLNATPSYTLNSAAVLIAPSATLVDNDSPNYNTGSLRVSIKANGDLTEKLEIGGPFTVTGTDILLGTTLVGTLAANSGTGGKDLFVRFNINSTRVVVEQLIQSLTFRTVNSSSSLNRTLSFLIRDNAGANNEALVDVNLGA